MQVTSCLLCLLINSITWLSPAACSFLLGRERTAASCWKCWSCSPHVLSQPCFVLSETLSWSNFLCYKTSSSLFWSSMTCKKTRKTKLRDWEKNERKKERKSEEKSRENLCWFNLQPEATARTCGEEEDEIYRINHCFCYVSDMNRTLISLFNWFSRELSLEESTILDHLTMSSCCLNSDGRRGWSEQPDHALP